MQYQAITLDATVFGKNSWNLETGMLAQLRQFREASVQFILSEVVANELCKYLTAATKKARDELDKAIRESCRSGLFTVEASERVAELVETALSSDDAVVRRFNAFKDETGMALISVAGTDIEELLRRYFEPDAPFEHTEKKKHEFPDAIALLSLEKWGESQNKRILAVSADKGWADFSQDSEWIDVEPDLVKALQTLQKQRAEKERDLRVEAGLAAMLRNLNWGDLPDLWEGVRDGIAHAVHRIEAYGDATSSPYFLKNEWVTLSLSDFRFSGGDAETNLSIVQIGDDTVVAAIAVSIHASAEGNFSVYLADSVNKELLHMGGTSAETNVDFNAEILLTFEGDLSATFPELRLSDLELLNSPSNVDFGKVDVEL